MRRTFTLHAALLALVCAAPAHAFPEKRVQDCVCHGMEREVSVGGTRADCMDGASVTEIDRTEKWAEAIGQVLYYASQTQLRPRVVLFCDEAAGLCLAHALRFEAAVATIDVRIELVRIDGSQIAAACGQR